MVRNFGVVPGLSRLPGQSSPFLSGTGELNASSKKDLISQLTSIINATADSTTQTFSKTNEEEKAARREALTAAMADKSGTNMAMLGAALASEVEETTKRDGFVPRLMQVQEVGQGEDLKVKVKTHDVYGYHATSASKIMPVEVRSRINRPPEFHLGAHILIDTLELAQDSDILEDKYEEGLEQIMVVQDRLWKKMADDTVEHYNPIQYFSSFTRSVFANLVNLVSDWGIPPTTTVFSSSLWTDVISSDTFNDSFSPVTQWELLQSGVLGVMYGTTVITDHFRQVNLRVLDRGDIYIVGAPINHGVITTRGGLVADPIDQHSDGIPKKGWFFDQLTSIFLANAKSVAVGKKI